MEDGYSSYTMDFCQADMDPVFMKELLDGIRETLFPKPLLCNGQEKLCRQMECCFYKDDKEGSGLAVLKYSKKFLSSFLRLL